LYKVTKLLQKVEKNDGSAFFYTPAIKENTESVFFENPEKIVAINSKKELNSGLEKIRELIDSGLTAYALIAYEFGYLLEERLENLLQDNYNFDLLKFFFFKKENVQIIKSSEIDFSGVSEKIINANYSIANFQLNTSKEKYISDINRVKEYISKGDTYQVNYTVKGKFNFTGSYSDLFLELLFNQSAEFSSFINNGTEFLVSASPELFFKNIGTAIETRPMKGTIKRGVNKLQDAELIKELRESKKDQAENVMIVDLLRNDLGKISQFNSVYAKSLFDIEQYESLFQMTSTVCSELEENDLNKIIRQIFPCGSITGAPKIRTMEIINELENEPRGIYTGSIGFADKEKNSFNVAIRTARIEKATGEGEIGIGSGVVWDSIPESEYEETLLKGSFLTGEKKYFEIFESILWENESFYLLYYHIKRLKNTAEYFLFCFDEENISAEFEKIKPDLDKEKKYKIKLLLDKWGKVKTEITELKKRDFSGRIKVSETVMNNDRFLYHKTTNRELYDRELKEANVGGFDEIIYLNQNGELTEGAFTNLFIEKKGKLYTPSVESGLLNGCLRETLLKTGKCSEKKMNLKDLKEADKLFIGNSVRGLIEIKEIETEKGVFRLNS